MSLIFAFDNACLNCSNIDSIWKQSVSYRCTKCSFINCLMCNKIHDTACDLFYKAKTNKNISVVTTSSSAVKATESDVRKIGQKRSLKVQELDLPTSDLDTSVKKPKIMKRRYTIAADTVLNKSNTDKAITEFKCNTCGTYYKTKATLSKHMKSNRHLVNSKKDLIPESQIKVDLVSSAETVINDFENEA